MEGYRLFWFSSRKKTDGGFLEGGGVGLGGWELDCYRITLFIFMWSFATYLIVDMQMKHEQNIYSCPPTLLSPTQNCKLYHLFCVLRCLTCHSFYSVRRLMWCSSLCALRVMCCSWLCQLLAHVDHCFVSCVSCDVSCCRSVVWCSLCCIWCFMWCSLLLCLVSDVMFTVCCWCDVHCCVSGVSCVWYLFFCPVIDVMFVGVPVVSAKCDVHRSMSDV